ncbi:MAG TPA: class I SAM-dependent methyltransferase [Lacipirellulaceae bacterium]|jgi:SAM-dependent methyltransferase|nr:class I SAM-dependent methyltransferase [Lacipirellulaceae bacterium]
MPFLIRSQSTRRKRNRDAWQQVGLVSGFLAGRHFVGATDLHYGYWSDGVEHTIRNMPRAQEDYCRFLLEHIPAGHKKILDVGCGAGGVAEQLVERGHQVDCVSPSAFLNSQARARLGDRARIFECKYEDFNTTETYDAVLFCESFQYMEVDQALEKVMAQLRPGGQLIISDFFRLESDGKSSIGGGHRLPWFRGELARYPFTQLEDIDITDRTAPTFTVIDSAFTQVLQPIWTEIDEAALATHPWIFKGATWFFRRKLNKVKNKYFTHQRSAENFKQHKTYRLMRFEKR